MSWKHAKIAVIASFADAKIKASGAAKISQNFTGLILPGPDLSGQTARSGLLIFLPAYPAGSPPALFAG
jgi:hypothetical protein